MTRTLAPAAPAKAAPSATTMPSSPRRKTSPQRASADQARIPAAVALDVSQVPVHPKHVPAGVTKLILGRTDDPLEREADRIAERITLAPDPPRPITIAPEILHASRNGSTQDADSDLAHMVHDVLRSPGRQLDSFIRSFMEHRFGLDFSGVRVHDDARAALSAQALSAQAYTIGKDLVFGTGKYSPDSADGKRLLAHELVHVAQQGSTARTSPSGSPHVIRRQLIAGASQQDQDLDRIPSLKGEEEPTAGGVSPGSFSFHTVLPDDGTGPAGGWQETDCETIRFAPPPFVSPTFAFDVRVRVGVPLRNQRQGRISPILAQAESIAAANLAGIEVTGLLNSGDITSDQAPQFFINLMNVHLLIDGRRVTSCSGGSRTH